MYQKIYKKLNSVPQIKDQEVDGLVERENKKLEDIHESLNANKRREIAEAIEAADVALEHLKRARQCLNSAGNWGLLDIFGGNWITGFVKHSKMNNAEREIDDARYALQAFRCIFQSFRYILAEVLNAGVADSYIN